MRVAQVGSGPDIVWVPGGDSPAEAWRGQMMHFAEHYRSTSYDPRGVGQTVSDPAPWSIADFARDCAGMIERKCKPPAMVRVVAELAMNGCFHELPGLGHVSVSRHRPDIVNRKLAEIISSA